MSHGGGILIIIAMLPFLGALLPGLMIRAGRNACAISTAVPTLLALTMLMVLAPTVMRGEVVQAQIEWLPQLGLSASFFLDGLGLLFAGMILGVGLLITLYARFYLSGEDPMGQFYTYLLLFQGAMLGIVLSDNILLLLIFWELTSLSSFLLIGYWKHLPEGRQGARMALAVTGAGGLAMIGGMLILGNIAGSYNLTDILQAGDQIRASEWYLPALILILLGAFTKSAQFPFHFWLPHAMAAPTPVSAYLHSATMVKAGVFLMARMWPVLAGTDAWFYIVATTGLVTMVLGALIALFKDDLKALLGLFHGQPPRPSDHAPGLRDAGGGGGGRLPHHQPPDLQGRALHDGGDRGPRDPYPRHQAAGRPEAPDADHLPDRDGRGAVDGGHPAVQRVPVQGDDAGGGLTHRLVRQSLRRARPRHARRAPVCGLFLPLRVPRLPRPGARRLPAQAP
jgi:hypothetical protein